MCEYTFSIRFWRGCFPPFNISKYCYEMLDERSETTHYSPTPVCVYPPFMFIVSKVSLRSCSNETCFYTQCWNASQYDFALVPHVPRWVPMLVDAPNTMSLMRHKRDFSITAAVITAVALAATGATVAAVAMSHTVQTAQTLNNLSASVAQALEAQTGIDGQLKGGLMVVNQQIDLVQEHLDVLWQLA